MENQQCGFLARPTQTGLYNYRRRLEAWNFGFEKKRNCTIRVAKTKVLISFAVTAISFAVTAKLICAFVFALAKIRFSHNAAHIFQRRLSCSRDLRVCTGVTLIYSSMLSVVHKKTRYAIMAIFFFFCLFSLTSLSRLFHLIGDRPISRWGENGKFPRRTT